MRAVAVPLAFLLAATASTAAFAVDTPTTVTPTGTTVVDDWSAPVSVSAPAGGQGQATTTGTTDGLLGGVRSVAVTAGDAASTVATTTRDGATELVAGQAGSGDTVGPLTTLTYDGQPATDATPAPGLDPTGLGAVDLTDAGTHTALVAAAAASAPGATVTLTVYTDATHCSAVTEPLPVASGTPGDGNAAVALRFADLTTGDPAAPVCAAPADVTHVGALTVTLDATAAPGSTIAVRTLRSAALDYGDLPSAWGATTWAEGGAVAAVDPSLALGSLLGGEADGTHSDDASADSHDDGLALTRGVDWSAATGGALDATVTGQGCLAVWLGVQPGTDLSVPGDEVVTGQAVTTGTTTVRFPLPAGFTEPTSVVARARLFPRDLDGSCTSPEPVTGVTNAGEVEDYVFALTPPPGPVSFTTLPQSPSASRAPSWEFTRPAGTDETCTVSDATGTVLTTAPCDRGYTARLDGDPDGSYTLGVSAADPLGRSAPPATSTYALSTVAPGAPVITGGPATPSNATSWSWAFTLPAGTTGHCTLDGPARVLTGGGCASGDAIDLAGRPDGAYTFAVTAVDAAGNLSAVTTANVVRDTTAPGPATFTTSPPAVTSDTTPTWTFTFAPADGAIPQCRLTGPAGLVQDWSPCGGTFSPALTRDGTYTLGVRGVDAAGNTGPTVSSVSTLDTVAPVPTITSRPASPGRSAQLAWSFVTGDTSATARCQLLGPGGSALTALSPCTAGVSYDETGRPDGTYTFDVQATDAAGNTGPLVSSAVLLDRVAPSTPVITSAPATPRHDPTVQWQLSGDSDAILLCELDGPTGVVSAQAQCGGTAGYDLSARPDGIYTLTVGSRDQAGNLSATVTSSVTLDRTAPGLALTSSPVGPARDRHPTWTFNTDAGGSPQCRLDLASGANVFPYSPCTSPFTADLTSSGDAGYIFSVRSVDAAGNVAGPVSSTYVLDTTPPAAPTITLSPQSPGNGRAPTWTFASEPGSQSSCRTLSGEAAVDGSGTPLTDWAPCAATWTADLGAVPDGLVTFQVRATDAAGNVGPAADAVYTLDTTAQAPQILTAPDSPGRATQVSWTYGLEPDETATCSLTNGAGAVIAPAAACGTSVTEQLTGVPDGTVQLAVTARDTAGNVSATTTSSYTLDTTPPDAPTFTGSPATPGTDRAPTWTFTTPPDTISSCRTVQGSVGLTSWQPCAGTTAADLTTLVDGGYSVQARATDAAGNVSAPATGAVYQLLTGVPAAPVITQTPGAGGRLQTAQWDFTTPGDTTGSCRLLEGTTVVSDWSPCSQEASYNLSAVGDGTLLFYTRAVDVVDATGPAATAAFVLDRTAPAPPVLADSPHGGASPVVSYTFTGDPGTTTTCQLTRNDGTVIAPYAACTNAFALDLSSHGAGTYVFSVRDTDTWGNVSNEVSQTYDYTPPVLPSQTEVTPGNPAGTAPSTRNRSLLARIVLPAVNDNEVIVSRPRAAPVKVVPPEHSGLSPPPVGVTPTKPVVTQAAPRTGGGLFSGPIGRVVGGVLSETSNHVALPLALIVLVLLFLAVQDRLDRGDPKLASAPLAGGGGWAEFR